MARKKSTFRTWFSARRLRWLAVRAFAALNPALAARLNFPAHSVRAVDRAETVLEDLREPVFLTHSPEEARDILAAAAANDTGDTSGTAQGRGIMRYQTAILRPCAIPGHTRTLVLEDGFRLINFDASPGNWNYAKPAILKRRAAGPGRHVLLEGAGHFYHLFANGIMPLLRYLELYGCDGLTLVTPAHSPGFESEVLAALARAHPAMQILPLGREEMLTGAEAVWLMALAEDYEWMPATRARADRLRAILEEYWAVSGAPALPAPAKKLYLDRGEAKLRRMGDDQAVRDVLEAHGYTGFVAQAGNFRAQVAAFSGADEIVAVHGAGLTNLLFCRPGTRIVEIFPENFVKSTYFWLARQMQLDYRYIIGGPGDYDQTFQAGAERLERAIATGDHQ
ncbi:MAG: DUF563 domain-containing protein [Beijerinckiaceae bacterium]